MAQQLTLSQAQIHDQIAAIAARYSRASTPGIDLMNRFTGTADGMLDRLPGPVRDGLLEATIVALRHATRAANSSRAVVGDQDPWVNNALSSVMGAAGGLGGISTALAELPLTTTLLLRAIQGVAAQYDFDPGSKAVQFDCVQVFASAGPLADDDGADLAFLSARLVVSGVNLQVLIARVAPQLALVLGKKLAAQMVPVLGAMAGATINYTYTRYYQEMAHVHFALRKLAIDADVPLDALIGQLRDRLSNVPDTGK